MISYHLESWPRYFADPRTQELWALHHKELARPGWPQGVDAEFYERIELYGQLQIMTVRHGGELIGYCLLVIKPHPHYKSVLCGFEDSYFVEPSMRRGGVGYGLIRRSCQAAKARGAKHCFFMTKLALDMAKLFTRLGGEETDRLFSIPLEGPKWVQQQQ